MLPPKTRNSQSTENLLLKCQKEVCHLPLSLFYQIFHIQNIKMKIKKY